MVAGRVLYTLTKTDPHFKNYLMDTFYTLYGCHVSEIGCTQCSILWTFYVFPITPLRRPQICLLFKPLPDNFLTVPF